MAESPTTDGRDDDGDDGRIGIFPSWNAVYASVVVATLLMIVLLYWFTVALDYSGT